MATSSGKGTSLPWSASSDLQSSFSKTHSDYKSSVTSLHLLPLMMQLELYDIMFFTNCLKKSKTFCVHSYVTLSTSSTRSATHFKLKHCLSKSNTIAHLYFNRLPRLWNSLPTIDLDLPISVIKRKLTTFFWDHFNANFHCNKPCTFHFYVHVLNVYAYQ